MKTIRRSLSLFLLLPALAGCTSARCLNTVSTHLTLGTAYLNEGGCEMAASEFYKAESACAAAAQEPEIQHRLGLSLMCQDLFADAEERMLLALELAKEPMPHALVNLSALYIAQERWGAAEEAAREALDDPTYAEAARAWNNAAYAAHQQGKLDEADEAYRIAIRQSPEFCPAWFGLGDVAEARGDLDAAQEHYRVASECAPTNLRYRFEHGRVLDLLGHLDEARDVLQSVVDRASDGELRARAEDLLTTLP